MALYTIWNGPSPTTAAQVAVTTGTAIKTMSQIKLGAANVNKALIVEWGVILENTAASLVKCELLTTGTVAATVTAHVAAGIVTLDPGGVVVTDDNPFGFGTTETGYTSTGEGTITATRVFDVQSLVTGTTFGAAYVKQWPLGREPGFKATEYLRTRLTATVAVNAYTFVTIEV
jgi:hypothetical protein